MEFYNEKEIQDILKIGPKAVHALFLNNDFPGIKVGKSYRVERHAFEEWVKNTKTVDLDYTWNGNG